MPACVTLLRGHDEFEFFESGDIIVELDIEDEIGDAFRQGAEMFVVRYVGDLDRDVLDMTTHESRDGQAELVFIHAYHGVEGAGMCVDAQGKCLQEFTKVFAQETASLRHSEVVGVFGSNTAEAAQCNHVDASTRLLFEMVSVN